MTTFVGCVSELYQGDLDLGRRAAERLAAERLGHDVLVEDLHYGAVAVAHRLREVAPSTLILVGATARGRSPGTVERRRVDAEALRPHEAQTAVEHAAVGYVDLDLVVQVAAGLGVLPARTVVVDVEPASVAPSDQLTTTAEAALERALQVVGADVRRAPVLELAETLRGRCAGDRLEPVPALDALRDLLRELERLDRDGTWGATFRERDRLRLRIAAGETGEGMDHLDWGLWWSLIEELDRLQQVEAVAW